MKTNGMILVFLLITSLSFAQQQINPIIKDYGTVMEVPFAKEKADPSLQYKILVNLMMGSAKPDSTVNIGLSSVATLLNLHGAAGVKKDNIEMVLAVHNLAGNAVLSNEEYKKKFGYDNPNIPLINALTEAGVKIYVCGQTVLRRKADETSLAPGIIVATSALTVITTYQLKGFAMITW